ncbi:DUF2291 domain-containing protein [Fulvimarina sp. MAC8]|uniref:DUF2291 family protein n=1 Tax=Fulvimarina sp. MAC8 TaxID=3162874 RepID=UPI0032EAF734
MGRAFLRIVCVIAALTPLSGFTIVWDEPQPADGAAPVATTDEERMNAYAAEVWDAQVLPVVSEHVVPLTKLRSALASNTDETGKEFGLRPKGEANPWNFVVSGEGQVLKSKLDSRAAKLEVDTDGDGKGDVTLQLGPIIRGTAIRDAMPFISFTDFRDQIEFAKLANGLNGEAHAHIQMPQEDPIGKSVSFVGVFTLRGSAESVELVPIEFEIGA